MPRTLPLAALLLSALLCTVPVSPSLGADPGRASARIDEDGTVTGEATVASAPAVVLSRVGDPAWVAQVGGGGTEVTPAGSDGACQLLDYVSVHPLSSATYRVRQCRSEAGFVASLVSSEAFTHYRTSWQVEPSGAGSAITYRIRVVSSLPIPDWMVRRATRSSVQELMEALTREL